jgi:hypothetical protein
MPFTLKFSDPAKPVTITVPDMPPGVNAVDTSLAFPGKGYPSYAQTIAQDFLSLLENFSGPNPPENPVEGQLWYDTSDPSNKTLRVMDGSLSGVNWPSANGIYQQNSDPRDTTSAGLKVGDIWVDTRSNQLKILNNGNWTVVGPVSSINAQTEARSVLATDGNTYDILAMTINSQVVAIVSGFTTSTFTPVGVIAGFNKIVPGINVSNGTTPSGTGAIVNGRTTATYNLIVGNNIVPGAGFLRSDGITSQVIKTSTSAPIRWQIPTNTTNWQGRDGLVMVRDTDPNSPNYVQLTQANGNAYLLNNNLNGGIYFQVLPSATLNQTQTLKTLLAITPSAVTVNSSTNRGYTFDVKGTFAANTVTAISSGLALSVPNGDAKFSNNVEVDGIFTATGSAYLTATVFVGHVLPIVAGTDIGSSSARFSRVYADVIGTGSNTIIYGQLNGSAQRLVNTSVFALAGQVVAGSSISFDGTTGGTFNTSLAPTAISSQTLATVANTSSMMLIEDSSTLYKISKKDFLIDASFTGMIAPYGGPTPPSGWLPCDGTTAYDPAQYPDLFDVIGYQYTAVPGGNFYTPNLSVSTRTLDGQFINYIIKT